MWALILITITGGSVTAHSITSVDNFKSRESCIEAIKFSKTRPNIQDAFCIKK